MRTIALGTFITIFLSGCASIPKPVLVAESESGYTYVPIDPFPIKKVKGDGCDLNGSIPAPLYGALPDNAVRMLVEQFNSSGSVAYGSAKLGSKGDSYRVTVDYINADTVNIPVWVAKTVQKADKIRVFAPLYSPDISRDSSNMIINGSESYIVRRDSPPDDQIGNFESFNIPVYVGTGLRASASVNVISSSANISGIGIIGAEAEAGRIKGTLVIQTLGINGKQISAALPISSELNRTTAQNAITAIASIKTLLYDQETAATPRVVGFYLPFPGGKPLVNALISALSKERVEWPQPCFVPTRPPLWQPNPGGT